MLLVGIVILYLLWKFTFNYTQQSDIINDFTLKLCNQIICKFLFLKNQISFNIKSFFLVFCLIKTEISSTVFKRL